MKYLLTLLLFTSINAQAGAYIGIGRTVYNPSDNGVWYQQGLDHHIDNESNSIQIGYKFDTEYPINIGYMNLGKINSWALATSDADFTGTGCAANPCAFSDAYIGRGEVEGFYTTVSPGIRWKDVKLFYTVGLWAYQARFNMTIIRGSYKDHAYVWQSFNKPDEWQVRPVIGIGAEYGKYQINLNAYGVDSGSEGVDNIPNYKGYAVNLSLIAEF